MIFTNHMKKIVGYCGSIAKYKRLKFDEVVKYCEEKGMKVVYINLDKPIEEKEKIDLIIHKLAVSDGKESNDELLQQQKYISEYKNINKDVIIIDDFESVELLSNRKLLNERIRMIDWPNGISIKVPSFVIINNSDKEYLYKTCENICFPVMAKSINISDGGHQMRVATGPDGLIGIKVPCLLQQYINHGGIVYKIYALKDKIFCDARRSTRDIGENEELSIDFNTSNSSIKNGLWDHTNDLAKVHIPLQDFKIILDVIAKNFNLNLFGFDILKDKDGVYWLCDINYFPGYKHIDNIGEAFFNLFENLLNNKT